MKTITIKVKVPQTEEKAHEMTKKDGDELVEECANKFMEICDSYEDPEQFKKDLSGKGELVLHIIKEIFGGLLDD